MYMDREEYSFTPVFSNDQDYVQQIFRPQNSYLKSIYIRFGVGWAGLSDKFVLRVELQKGDEVFFAVDVVLYDENNWRYCEFKIEQYVNLNQDYTITVRQIEGPYKEKTGDEYAFSYTVFNPVEHVTENETQYYFNGEAYNGEFEVCYLYEVYDNQLVCLWLGINVGIFLILLLSLEIKKRIPMNIQNRIGQILWIVFPLIIYLLCEYILGNLYTIEFINHIKNIIICYIIYGIFSILLNMLNLVCIFQPNSITVPKGLHAIPLQTARGAVNV